MSLNEVPLRKRTSVAALDETEMTEITIGPDGRIHVFGLSATVLEALASMAPSGHPWRRRAEQCRMSSNVAKLKEVTADEALQKLL